MGIHIANAERLVLEAMARAIKPPPPVNYLRWAEDNIVFTARESLDNVGPYNSRKFAYFNEVLRALSPDDPCRIVTLMGSAQVGKTVVGNVFVGGSMDMDPRDFMFVHPTEENASRWSKMKLTPMIRGTPCLDDVFPAGSRDGANSILFKEHRHGLGAILISGANSPASLSQVTMSRQVQDDLAKWDVNNAGDPEAQADSRSAAVINAKILKTSTPLIMPGCRITKSFEQGSREKPFVPCPHCGEMQVLEWENMLSNLDPDKPEEAHFSCVACGVVIEQVHRQGMIDGLEWRAENPSEKRYHRSFWIWAAYGPLTTWEEIARHWLRVKGDSAGEQVFLNDKCGKAYQTKGEAPPWEDLKDRAAESHYSKGQIPVGALVLTMGIDCQGDRVEWQLVGWGRDFRRYVIDYGIIPGHISDEICRGRLDSLMKQTWPNAFGHRIGLDRVAIDGNAWTEDVWGWAKRHPRSKVIMVRGRHEEGVPRIARVKKERNDRTGKLLKWAGRFFNFAASLLKMSLYRDLAKKDPIENGYVFFPSEMDDEYFRQLTAEHRKAVKKKDGFEKYVWHKDPTQANEALDTMNQADTAARNFGVYGMPDATWLQLEQLREVPLAPDQPDLEDLLNASQVQPPIAPAQTKPIITKRSKGRRVLSPGIS